MIRHGYSNCVACHVSPSGGGILTQYGRSLASELLTANWLSKENEKTSTKNGEQSEVVETWLKGVDARVLTFHRKNEYEDSYLTIPMQLDVTGAYNTEKYTFVLGLGLSGSKPSGGEGGTAFRIPNLYGIYRFTEEMNIRGGLFLPNYGLNNSLHAMATRGPMGFGFKDQRPGIEFSYLSDSWGVILSQFGSRGTNLGDNAWSAQLQYSPTEKSKFAINHWSEGKLRTISGIWFMVPIYESLYFSADYNVQKDKSTNTDGLYYLAKIGYEIKQGMHVYAVGDNSQRDMDRSYTKVSKMGVGFQLFPILHWEIDTAWMREKNPTYSSKEADYAYILAHYYL
jgi:hypothetical protein